MVFSLHVHPGPFPAANGQGEAVRERLHRQANSAGGKPGKRRVVRAALARDCSKSADALLQRQSHEEARATRPAASGLQPINDGFTRRSRKKPEMVADVPAIGRLTSHLDYFVVGQADPA
jgi:hypothetical protein